MKEQLNQPAGNYNQPSTAISTNAIYYPVKVGETSTTFRRFDIAIHIYAAILISFSIVSNFFNLLTRLDPLLSPLLSPILLIIPIELVLRTNNLSLRKKLMSFLPFIVAIILIISALLSSIIWGTNLDFSDQLKYTLINTWDFFGKYVVVFFLTLFASTNFFRGQVLVSKYFLITAVLAISWYLLV